MTLEHMSLHLVLRSFEIIVICRFICFSASFLLLSCRVPVISLTSTVSSLFLEFIIFFLDDWLFLFCHDPEVLLLVLLGVVVPVVVALLVVLLERLPDWFPSFLYYFFGDKLLFNML